MPALQSETFTFDARPHYPLLIPVTRYWNESLHSQDADALTFVLAHGTSFHNEHWEPVLEGLYDLLATSMSIGTKIPNIREAWAIGCPNHGEGAVLNEETLKEGYSPIFSWDEYGTAIHLVLAGRGKGVDVDFSTRNLVALGHSMGAIALILARTHAPVIRWSKAILIEPMFVHPKFYPRVDAILRLSAPKRRDVWSSREEARQAFLSKSFKSWDPRLVDIYAKHGLRDLPTATYPDATGVTLKCTKAQEAAAYSDVHGRMTAQRYLPTFCTDVPTHAIFGAVPDILPSENRDFLVKDFAQNKFASVSLVEKAGHLAAHNNPDGVAERIYEALMKKGNTLSKL
ncbi:Alpha/beta hydrolase fold-1 [Amylostereum chailletii]|nr:Alpha/beta hydrolase fold-1 [Amylostereum chailletii]